MSVDGLNPAPQYTRRRASVAIAAASGLTVHNTLAQSWGFERIEPAQDSNTNLLDLPIEDIQQSLRDALYSSRSRGSKAYVKRPLRFDNGAVSISPQTRVALGKLGQAMASDQDLKLAHFHLEGHANRTGPRELNLRLTKERAFNVRQVLLQYGISSQQISTEGYGFDYPLANLAPTHPDNRRVEILVSQA